MNLIFSNGELKSTKFSSSETYSFDQITFFIEKKYVNLQFYCVVKDHTDKIDLLRLKQTNSTSASYYNYVCSMDFPTKAKDGKCTISLFGIDLATSSIEVSTPNFELNVKNDIYNFKAQISMLEEFNQNAANIYNKILSMYNGVVEMSNLNAKILSKEGVVTK